MNDATQFFNTSGGGYQIERSLRFNSADSAYLSRTPAVAGNQKTWTWSGWVKRSGFGTQLIYAANGNGCIFWFNSDKLEFYDFSGSYNFQVRTTAVFRDASAWYHLVVALDTDQAAASNRIKLYVNGLQITTFDIASYPSSGFQAGVNTTTAHYLATFSGLSSFLSGYLADIHFIDGQALTPSSFAETNATTGQWVPKAYTGTYGTNGFHLPFSDNSTATALGTDTSGNGNNWTPNNLIAGPAFTSNSWSGYFDGSGDFLTTPSNSAFDFGSGDFTIEFWVFTVQSGFQAFVGTRTGDTASTIRLSIFKDVSEVLSVNVRDTGNNDIASFSFQNTLPLNQWVHCSFVKSGTNFRLYQNGVQSTSSATSSASVNNSSNVIRVGNFDTSIISNLNGYISNLRILKGTALYTSNFTPPTSPLTAVTNTSLLTLQDSTFVDNSTNNFTITANGNARTDFRSPFEESVDTDSFVDSPTSYGTDTGAGGEVRGNYCTLNPLDLLAQTLANGNLQASGSTDFASVIGSIGVFSGKWYWEITSGSNQDAIGIWSVNSRATTYPGGTADSYSYYANNGNKYNNNSFSAYGATFAANDIIGVALDLDSGTLTFYKNNVSQGVAFSGLTGGYRPALRAGASAAGSTSTYANFGQRPFAYTAPSGFKALCDTNLPEPTIADGSTAMDVVTYTGNGSTQTISGLGFSPDLVWVKCRSSSALSHILQDTVRGVNKTLFSDLTNQESTVAYLTSFNSDGFGVDGTTFNPTNQNGQTYVGWTWDAGSSTVTNTDGTITSQVRANPSAGFSVVTVNSTTIGTIGHGLGVKPAMIIEKCRGTTSSWYVRHQSLGDMKSSYLRLNLTNAAAIPGDTTAWNNTEPTSTTISINNNYLYANGSVVYYCFAPVAGYSAFGSYTGNGSADGPFVYTGMRSRYILIKRTDAAESWIIFDTARNSFNVVDNYLYTNETSAENIYGALGLVDILSNGFKFRRTELNANGATFIYAAFAENPFQYARAR